MKHGITNNLLALANVYYLIVTSIVGHNAKARSKINNILTVHVILALGRNSNKAQNIGSKCFRFHRHLYCIQL